MARIRPLPADGVVREAGAYRIPIDHYHTQAVCPGPSISSGGLRTILLKSPADFWAFSDLNPDRYERKPSDAFAKGRAAHALLLGDEVFTDAFMVLPDDAPPRPTKTQVRAAEAGRTSTSYEERNGFWEAFDAACEGRTVIRSSWMTDIEHMAASLARHQVVGPLFDGDAEVSLVWQDEQTGVWVKARPDMLPRMGDVKADLKTCADASLMATMRDVRKFGYDMQAALGCIGAEVCLGQKITTDALVFVQSMPPYHVTAIEVTEDALHWAKLRLRVALNTFATCLATGHWPAPVEGIPQFGVPDHQLEAYAAEQAAGSMPHDFFAPFGAFGEGNEE